MSSTISVLIPAFNASRHLADAIDSVLRQTRRADEIIVVDDGSTDETPRIIEGYGSTVTCVRRPNGGDGAARNTGLDITTSKYVAFLDADDVSAPERLELQVAQLEENPDAAVCFSGHWTFSDGGRVDEFPASSGKHGDSLDLLAQCLFMGPSAMFDRTRARGLRFLEDKGSAGGDIIFSALLATRGKVVVVERPLYGYRLHSRQKSAHNRADATSNRFFEYRYRWAKAHWNEYWPERSWAEVERKMWGGLAVQTEQNYWARRKNFFLNDRNYLRRNWPSHLPPPAVTGWRWFPQWLWDAKNQFDRLVKKRHLAWLLCGVYLAS